MRRWMSTTRSLDDANFNVQCIHYLLGWYGVFCLFAVCCLCFVCSIFLTGEAQRHTGARAVLACFGWPMIIYGQSLQWTTELLPLIKHVIDELFWLPNISHTHKHIHLQSVCPYSQASRYLVRFHQFSQNTEFIIERFDGSIYIYLYIYIYWIIHTHIYIYEY